MEWNNPWLLAWFGAASLTALWLGLFLVFLGSGMMQLVAMGASFPIISAAAGPGSGRVAGAVFPATSLEAGAVTVAVVIENHVESRPTHGLERARIVYEAPVEGDITRYVAIFDREDLSDVIGPVRSARPYLADWADEWSAVLWHSGASPAAYQRFRAATSPHVDEISALGRYFWREETRGRPHNLFTSGSAIRQAIADVGLPVSGLPSSLTWVKETAVAAPGSPSHPAVRIRFRDVDYCVGFFYDRERDAYQRWLGGAPHVSAGGEPMFARTVLVPVVSATVVDAEGRLALATRRGGDAHIFIHGRYTPGTWQWLDGKTRFWDETGTAVLFPPGPIWITVATTPGVVTVPDPEESAETALRCEDF